MNALNYEVYENDFSAAQFNFKNANAKTKPQTQAKPFVKWAGGKRALLDTLIKFMPKDFNAYFEPFLGGGALFFELANRGILKGKKVYLNDKNAELINAYNAIKHAPHELLRELKILQENHSKEQFYSIRALDKSVNFRTLHTEIFRAARFIYLNKTCFNGLCRYNAKGEFNTPMGSYKSPKIHDETLILNAHFALQNAELFCGDFDFVRDLARGGDFVYFDPPYFPLNSTSSFVSYTDNFSQGEQERLCALFNELNSRKIRLLQSNSNTDFIKNLYAKFEIHTIFAKRAINCKGERRGAVSELLIRGKSE